MSSSSQRQIRKENRKRGGMDGRGSFQRITGAVKKKALNVVIRKWES